MSSDPPRDWQNLIYNRLHNDDPTAFAELYEAAAPRLETYLISRFPNLPRDDLHDVIVDLFLALQERPEQYDPAKLSLFAYLRMAARRDALNRIERLKRQSPHSALSLDEWDEERVEDQDITRNILQEEDDVFADSLRAPGRFTFEDVLVWLRLQPQEEEVLRLMVEGVRQTERYAQAIGLSESDPAAQQHEVKKMKDRLKKRVRRILDEILAQPDSEERDQ